MVRFENVGVRYGVGPEVLRDINLHIEPGSFYFLTGASGAGKSSLLKLMYFALLPSRGCIQVFGEDISRTDRRKLPELRRRIGVVFQDFKLLPKRTVFENIAFALRFWKKALKNFIRIILTIKRNKISKRFYIVISMRNKELIKSFLFIFIDSEALF